LLLPLLPVLVLCCDFCPQHAVPAFITIVTMPMCYSIAYGVIASCCSYIVLYLGNFLLDLIGVALGRDSIQNVLFNNCPDALQDRIKIPAPMISPSAVLQVRAAGSVMPF
jgi:xanthine/uracil/vitamin C permease (AzgA family)